MKHGRIAGALIALVWLAGAAPAVGAGETDVTVLRAGALARAGKCPDALALLQGVSGVAAAADLRGHCEFELHHYPEAVAAYQEAKRLDPGLADVDLHLGMALFHQGDLVGAQAALDAAEVTSPNRAELYLYRGLLQLERAESGAAAASLERARDMDPTRVEPTASYYAGLAFAASDDAAQAEASLDRVIAEAPGTVWATEAEKAKARLHGAAGEAWWAWVKGGIEYDSNVALRGDGVVLPNNISGKGDWRGVWMFNGGYEFIRNENWSAGVTATYYGSAQFELTDFNQQYPILGFWVDRRLAEPTVLRFRYDAGYGWVDEQPFSFDQRFGPSLYQDWGAPGRTRFFAEALHSNYFFQRSQNVPAGTGTPGTICPGGASFCGPPGLNEHKELNRTGWGESAGLDHVFRLGELDTDLSGGYRYTHYNSDGTEYQFDSHEIWLASETLLPYEFTLRLFGSYSYLPFDNVSVFPSPKQVFAGVEYPLKDSDRLDQITRFRVEVERPISDAVSLSVAYSFTNNSSNTAVYDYSQNIVGFYVTYRFDR